jgi:hypothetical protein
VDPRLLAILLIPGNIGGIQLLPVRGHSDGSEPMVKLRRKSSVLCFKDGIVSISDFGLLAVNYTKISQLMSRYSKSKGV